MPEESISQQVEALLARLDRIVEFDREWVEQSPKMTGFDRFLHPIKAIEKEATRELLAHVGNDFQSIRKEVATLGERLKVLEQGQKQGQKHGGMSY